MRKTGLKFFKAISLAAILTAALCVGGNILKNRDGKNKVLGEETSDNSSGRFYTSENYKITQFTIKGEGGMQSDNENEETILEISDVRSEVYSLKDKDETRALISWKTNKTATSEMAYEKKAEKIEKKIRDDGYSLNHSVIIENLDADSIYGFRIKNVDKWGSEKGSDEYVFYTGAPNVSLIDVLENATTKLFGWAIKK